MKSFITSGFVLAAALCMSAGCRDMSDDGALAPAKVYMSQTSVSAGTVDNIFHVPADENSYTVDYENNILNVVLGVAHDHIPADAEVVVDIQPDMRQTERSYIGISKGEIMPDDVWSLPERVTIPVGERQAEFTLAIDLDLLQSRHMRCADSNLVLAVKIAGSSHYAVSEAQSTTIVVVDGASFIPNGDDVKISMPQASLYDGETENQYPIPFTGNPSSYLFDAETGILSIFLNVQRTGIIPLRGYAVSVVLDGERSREAAEEISRGAVLPADAVRVPSVVEAGDGVLNVPFTVEVDVNRLVAEYPDLSKSKLVMAVALDSPTEYVLDPQHSCTVVVVNAPTFYPRDPNANLVKGGDFGEDSEQYWTFNAEEGHDYTNKVMITDGRLVFSITRSRCLVSLFQKITFENSGMYNMALTFYNPDGANGNSNARSYVALTRLEPVIGSRSEYTSHPIYSMIDVWGGENSGLFAPRTGQFVAEETDLKGIDTEGNFTITEDQLGDWYVIINGASYNDGSLNIAFDDLFIGEVVE